MTDIFTEVDESVRQEKLESWWKRWRPFVYGAVAALIGAVAVNEFILKPGAAKARAERALELEKAVKALEEGQYEEAANAFRAIVEADTKLSPLAAHFLAQTQIEGMGDPAAAAETLAAAGGTEGGPFERLALLKAAYLRADTLTLDELETTLGTLPGEDTALGALARELVASKAAAVGDIARARTAFNQLKFDANAPAGVVQRAEIALAALPLAPEAGEETPAPAPADAPEENGQ
ncbi:MAG: tetratricopeptide repeat protein [Hyphomonas sp.]